MLHDTANADVYLAKAELDFWTSDAARDQAKASHKKMFVEGRAALAPYQAAGRIRTFPGPAELFPGITAIPAPRHTPGHTFYRIESHGRRMLVVGDIVHAAEIQLPDPSVTIDFDIDPAAAAARVRQLWLRSPQPMNWLPRHISPSPAWVMWSARGWVTGGRRSPTPPTCPRWANVAKAPRIQTDVSQFMRSCQAPASYQRALNVAGGSIARCGVPKADVGNGRFLAGTNGGRVGWIPLMNVT